MDTFVSQPTMPMQASNPQRIPAIEPNNEIRLQSVTSDEPTSLIIHSALRSLPLRFISERTIKD
jgi:hypothetical protein